MGKWFHRVDDHLVPFDEPSLKSVRKLEPGELVELEQYRSRSPSFNAWYWACCTEIGHNQDPARSKESISDEIKVRSGHYTVMLINIGDELVEVRSPKHINFRAMNADQWNEYFKNADQVMLQHFQFDSQAFKSGNGWKL